MKVIAEYIWLDGKNRSEEFSGEQLSDTRGKTKIFDVPDGTTIDKLILPSEKGSKEGHVVPVWGFDGSSTMQATGDKSDCVLKPVRIYKDPFRSRDGALSIIVLNEVYLAPGDKPHASNTRAALEVIAKECKGQEFWFGIEQEYTLMRLNGEPFGFPEGGGRPVDDQGKYYCGVGADKLFGRSIVEEHVMACLEAGILIAGINAEVMPGQWEYQIGNGTSASDPLRVADDLIVARYLMDRIGEKHGVIASLDPKPLAKWNGAGAHTNFSTKSLRESLDDLSRILERLGANHEAHIKVYGKGIESRLTGKHETASYERFSSGVSDRGASIRIPWQVARDGKGYIEDRRPCANINPYIVIAQIMETTRG